MGAALQYRRVRVSDPKVELRMVSELRKLGQPFKAVSKTDYIISNKQCTMLKSKKIPYEPIS